MFLLEGDVLVIGGRSGLVGYDRKRHMILHSESWLGSDAKAADVGTGALSSDGAYFCWAFNTVVKVIATASWTTQYEFSIPRKASSVVLHVADSIIVIISDKTSEVFSYLLEKDDTGKTTATPQFLLGHTSSVITDMCLSQDSKYLVTGDRDEKIRVSNYPAAYEIQSFCLGHEQFISRLCFPDGFDVPLLLSGSGDGTVRLWNYVEGTELAVASLPDGSKSEPAGPATSSVASHTISVVGAISGIAWSEPLRQIAVSVFNDSHLYLYSLARKGDRFTLTHTETYSAGASPPYSIACDKDGSTVILLSDRVSVRPGPGELTGGYEAVTEHLSASPVDSFYDGRIGSELLNPVSSEGSLRHHKVRKLAAGDSASGAAATSGLAEDDEDE